VLGRLVRVCYALGNVKQGAITSRSYTTDTKVAHEETIS
jgi:hypothetical protein